MKVHNRNGSRQWKLMCAHAQKECTTCPARGALTSSARVSGYVKESIASLLDAMFTNLNAERSFL